jgi:hypothetical protein
MLFVRIRVLKRFTKAPHLLAKCLSLLVGELVFRVVGPAWFLQDVKPSRTPRRRPAEGGMVAALLGKERRTPGCFLLPTSLNEFGLNLAQASLK